ncbi:MAG: cobyrinic acid a,c-diamide synthase [Actinomycetes bacterium]
MSGRVTLPGASELFRPTSAAEPPTAKGPAAETPGPAATLGPAPAPEPEAKPEPESKPGAEGSSRGSGRIRHEEKITVYVSRDELLALEQARLTLRAHYDTAVDRGRIVREAVAAALAELEVAGADSELVRRLAQR